MEKVVTAIFGKKKVHLRDIASPKPSRAATRVINGAVKRAHADQQAVLRQAKIQSN